MRALRLDGELRLTRDAPVPRIPGETLVRVSCAGICKTDLEIIRGYAGFTGILGHEFVGVVAESENRSIVGKRVVGEINAGCGRCADCRAGDPRHCPDRTVLGIKNRDGAFAEFLSLPPENLIEVPDSISDLEAVFLEPLAAACHILDQVDISSSSAVAVVGDGKLAQLVVMALRQTGCRLTLVGKHERKLDLASGHGARVVKFHEEASDRPVVSGQRPVASGCFLVDAQSSLEGERFDVVVEASGSRTGLEFALGLVKPRGVLVLKSTHHGLTAVDTSPIVVNEITVLGSRCGRLGAAIGLMSEGLVDVKPLVSRCIPMSDWATGFTEAACPDNLKIILSMA